MSGRPHDTDGLFASQVSAMLRDFTDTLRRRHGVADERRLVISVRFHAITDGRNGGLPRSVDAQARSLNAAYGGTEGGEDTGVSPTLNCPVTKDTCPQPGTDLVHHFMDYAWELRIRTMGVAYRNGVPGRFRRQAAS